MRERKMADYADANPAYAPLRFRNSVVLRNGFAVIAGGALRARNAAKYGDHLQSFLRLRISVVLFAVQIHRVPFALLHFLFA